MSVHPSNFVLDQLVAREVEPSHRDQLEAHLADCPRCREYIEARSQDRLELMEQLPPQVFAHQVEEAFYRSEKRRTHRSWRNWLIGSPFVAAAAVILVLIALPEETVPPDSDGPDIRWMGEDPVVRTQILRDQQLISEPIPQAGDRLRYEITMPPGESGYALVVAVEDGEVFPLLPADGQPVEVNDATWMPGSVQFDPGGQVALLLFIRPERMDVPSVLHEVRRSLDDPTVELEGLVHELDINLDR